MSIMVLCGIENIPWDILFVLHACGGIFHGIFLVPRNIVMDLYNVMPSSMGGFASPLANDWMYCIEVSSVC